MSDVFTFGETMLRLSVPSGSRLENAASFDVSAAGSEANVAAALAQIGVDVAWHSILPECAFGRRVAGELSRFGVDTDSVQWVSEGRLGTFFVELSDPPRPVRIIYDRADATASHMSASEFPWGLVEGARLVHITGITPALSTSCRDLGYELAHRVASTEALLSLDVNYRSKLWSPTQAQAVLEKYAGRVDLLIVNRDDASSVFGATGEPVDILAKLHERFGGPDVVLSLGSEGSVWQSGSTIEFEAPRDAVVVDRLGAGDAFAAGVIAGYLEGNLGDGVRMGTVMAALMLGIKGDFLLTTRDEVIAIVNRQEPGVDR